MLLLLLINPNFLFDVGFQMSYVAVFSIVWIQPGLASLWTPNNSPLRYLWQLATVTMAAQVGLLPLTLHYFHQFPALFLPTNLVVLPFLGIIVILGFLVCGLALLGLSLPAISWGYESAIDSLNSFVSWMGSFEGLVFDELYISRFQATLAYFTLLIVMLVMKRRSALRLIGLGLGLVMLSMQGIVEKKMQQSIQELLVFQRQGTSLLAVRDVSKMLFYGDTGVVARHMAKDYIRYSRLKFDQIEVQSIPEVIPLRGFRILVVDSLNLYRYQDIRPDLVLLRKSPKVHMVHLLELLRPKIVVADGSNYYSDIDRWTLSCVQQKTPFHATARKGAFRYKFDKRIIR
jgi:competence protein ComEC